MKAIKLLVLIMIGACCPKSECFEKDQVGYFEISSIKDNDASKPVQDTLSPIIIDCPPGAVPCPIEVFGRTSGVIEQECPFIFVVVKSTEDGNFHIQKPGIKANEADATWLAKAQIGGDSIFAPKNNERFLIQGIVTGSRDAVETLDAVRTLADLRVDFVETSIVLIQVRK